MQNVVMTEETLLHARQCIDGMVDVEQLAVVGDEVRTNLWIDTRRPLAMLTSLEVAAMHAIHIG